MSEDTSMTHRPTLTESRAIHAVLKAQPEDFEVEEIAKMEPAGSGDHCWVWIEKRDLTTPEAARRLAHAVRVDPRGIGWAGLKDRHAVTRQWLSIPGVTPDQVTETTVAGLRVLDARPHPRKIRSGVLAGNRFRLLLREVDRAHLPLLREILQELMRRGAPNYFGGQRFGRDGRNVEAAKAWLVGGGRPPRDRFRRKLFVSSLQSAVFNHVLARRIRDGTMDRVLPGDLLKKTRGGRAFHSTEPTLDQKRLDHWELSPTGPIFGAKMQRSNGAAGAIEAAAEAEHGLGPEVYRAMGKLGAGTRRPLRVRIEAPELETCADGVRLCMTLPSGAYATEVLRELFKDGLVDASRQPSVTPEASRAEHA